MSKKPLPATEPLVQNFLNVEDVDSWLEKLADGYKPNVQAWVKSTLRRHVLASVPGIPVVRSSSMNSPAVLVQLAGMSKADKERVYSNLHMVLDSKLPEWATRYLDNLPEAPLVFFRTPSAVHFDRWRHRLDYMEAELPDKPCRQTPQVIIDATTAWDKRLARQKLFGALADGTEMLDIPWLKDAGYVLVKLLTSVAYKNEGAAMGHCVANYFGKRGCSIYSVRSLEVAGLAPITEGGSERPSATIEIRGGVVWQVKAAFNKQPVVALAELLPKLYEHMKWKQSDEDDECDEEEDDEDDEEYEDDEEEDDEERPRKRGKQPDNGENW